ncbi:hypothetical protein [Chryseobacterium sp. MMS23-Vi53]|uniref:hypothetical protein n=1 Tax=Chryseobacterium sp. MMS23-Vi53 TaxID=3386644 RepID=UPI0039E8FB5B
MQVTDSIKKIEKKCLALSPNPVLYINITQRFLSGKEKNLDSAEYYLDKASKIVSKFSDYEKGNVFFYYGNLYTEKKEYEKAIDNYLKSIEIFEKNKHDENLRDSYRFIAEVYHQINNKNKEAEYFHKYQQISEAIIEQEKKGINISVEKTIKEKESHHQQQKNKLYGLIIAIFLVILVISYFIFKAYQKKKKAKDDLILEKSLETNNLKKQLDSSAFEEIKHLAQTGDPFFLARFQEIYPDFINTLTSNYPDLTANDIKFCAFLKLNLSNKEIMQYEHLSIRTVETKKYRLRKKLGISSKIDLNKWFMEL